MASHLCHICIHRNLCNFRGFPSYPFATKCDGFVNKLVDVSSVESDPTGKGAHEAGAKLDAGKPRHALVFGGFANALDLVSRVGTFGANKYTDNGWKSVENAEDRYLSALYRHLLAHQRGEAVDGDSGLPHLAHAAWNALAILELQK